MAKHVDPPPMDMADISAGPTGWPMADISAGPAGWPMANQAEVEVEKFEFVTEPNHDYFCPVTLEVMLNPRQTECCGRHLSSSVVERLASENKPCPVCKAPSPQHRGSSNRVFVTHRDQFFQRIILDLKVRCPHRERGCEWVGTLREVRDHSASCGRRPWKCLHCKQTMTYDVGTTQHAHECPQRPIFCSCSQKPIPYSMYESHMTKCPIQTVSCDFADVGCGVVIRRKEQAGHMKDYLHHHQLLVSQMNLKMTRSVHAIVQTEFSELRKELEEKRNKVSDLQREMISLKGEVKETAAATTKEILKKIRAEEKRDVISLKDEMKETAASITKEILEKIRAEGDRELQVNRLMEQIQERNETIRELQERKSSDAISLGSSVLSLLTDTTQELKSKKNLPEKEVKKLVLQLEEIVTGFVDGKVPFDSDNNDDYVVASSPMNVPCAEEKYSTRVMCKGKLERTFLKGLEQAWGIAVADGVVYVVDSCGSQVVYKVDGTSVKTMIESASYSDVRIPKGKSWYPRGVALDKNSDIILADTGSHRILKFSCSGKFIASAGDESKPGTSDGKFNSPVGVGVDQTGRIFVCDRFNHRIQILDSNLEFVDEFGKMGEGLLEFKNPWDVAFDSHGNAYIADCGNRCVKVFNSRLSPIHDVGKGGDVYRIGDLRAPTSVCVDGNDNLYVTDSGLKKVLVYGLAGDYRGSFGRFRDPFGICVDKEGHVYVSDNGGSTGIIMSRSPGRVQLFI